MLTAEGNEKVGNQFMTPGRSSELDPEMARLVKEVEEWWAKLDRYEELIYEFEDTAGHLSKTRDSILSNYEISDQEWKDLVTWLAEEYQRLPRLLLDLSLPSKYRTLWGYYGQWADACSELSHCLREEASRAECPYPDAAQDYRLSVALDLDFAHTNARHTYLRSYLSIHRPNWYADLLFGPNRRDDS